MTLWTLLAAVWAVLATGAVLVALWRIRGLTRALESAWAKGYELEREIRRMEADDDRLIKRLMRQARAECDQLVHEWRPW